MRAGRAYSLLTIKSVDPDQRTIAGWASTPDVDRMGDVVEPRGATFAPSIPLLLYHDNQRPVGTVTLAAADDGIAFNAHIPDIAEPGTLRDRVTEAWQTIRAGLIKGVSIGFRAFDDGVELLKSGGLRFTKFEILELSLVAIPANANATIHTIKSYDAPNLAAFGNGTGTNPTGGVPPTRAAIPARKDYRSNVKPYAEQIADYSAMRNAAAARMDELMKVAANEARTLDDDTEGKEYENLEVEIVRLDTHLTRLRAMDKANQSAAKAVAATNTETASASRGGGFVQVRSQLPPGIEFTRYVLCKIAQYKEGVPALHIARERYPDSPRVANAFLQKANVPAATTTESTWLGALVENQTLAGEFVEYLRPQTIVGKFGTDGIPSLRRVPFNVRVVGQDTGASADWVGQGKAKPLTRFSISATTLGITKVACISVITEELARTSSPSAEAMVRDELIRAVVERIDTDFIEPAVAEVANINPASITNGLTPLTSSGTDADAVRNDLQTILSAFMAENQDLSGLVLIMPNTVALALSLMTNSLGQPEFGSMGLRGGNLRGIPVITSQYAANPSTGAGNLVIAVNANEIFLADDGGVAVDVSREASLEMSDAPAHDSGTPTAASLVSMWQTNSIALRAERFINWKRRRTGAVQYMDDVGWGGAGSPTP